MIGLGSQYAGAATDSEGKPLGGGKTYKVHLPPNIPAKDFWSFIASGNRAMLEQRHSLEAALVEAKDEKLMTLMYVISLAKPNENPMK